MKNCVKKPLKLPSCAGFDFPSLLNMLFFSDFLQRYKKFMTLRDISKKIRIFAVRKQRNYDTKPRNTKHTVQPIFQRTS